MSGLAAQRLALALRRTGANVDKGTLDVGLGAGTALRAAGFDVIDGVHVDPSALSDVSEDGPWRAVWQVPNDGLGHIASGDYATIVAVDVLHEDAEPDHTLSVLLGALALGGRLGLVLPQAPEDHPVLATVLRALQAGGLEVLSEETCGDGEDARTILVLARA